MGNCKSFGKQKASARKLTLAILGLDNSGKTVTTKGLQGEALDTVAPTIGFSSVEFRFEKHDITLFDLGGGKRIRDIWKNYFSEIYGLIYVVDSSEPERMEESKSVLRNVLEHSKVAGKPVLVLANKQDISGALDEIDICEHLDLEETVNMNKCPCRVETCSAILGQGKKLDKSIHNGFSWLLSVINSNLEKLNQRVEKDVQELREKEAQEKKDRAERVRIQREEREKQKKQERTLRGEKESDSEEEDVVDGGGDPFKKLDLDQLTKKEQQLKEAKVSSRKKHLEVEEDSDEDDLPRSSLRASLTPRALPPIERSPRPTHKSYTNKDSDNDDSDNDVASKSLSSRYPWNKSTTPRPLDGSAPLDLAAPRFVGSRSHDDGSLGVGEYGKSNRRALAPLSPLSPLAPLEPLDADKKKKKKKAKKNQTGPSLDDEEPPLTSTSSYPMSSTLNGLDLPEGPRSWNSSGASGGTSRGLLRASRSPRLETLQEPENGEEVYSSTFNKYGLEDGLPELAPEVTSRRGTRPNSDYDSVLT